MAEAIATIVVVAWLIPVGLVLMAIVGYLHGRRLRTAPSSLLIIQITTIGNEHTVNEIIKIIRGYALELPYQIWVVTEPDVTARYEGADSLVVVPRDFVCKASYKARALEYSRLLRAQLGLIDREIKILYVDDDSIPTKGYIEKAFVADYDICQGIIAPRNNYGRLLSHLDNLRTINCLTICAVFQGFGRPLWVHGEGLCVRASAEQAVTWNYPVFASEDMVFGQMAKAKGLKWGFFYDFVHITSPYSFGDFLIQRRRWLWGNIHAIRHILPRTAKTLLVTKWILGPVCFFVATIGTSLQWAGLLSIPAPLRPLLFASLLLWLASFAVSGWINSRGSIRQTVFAALLAWPVAAANVLVLLVGLGRGNPGKFEVIEKTASSGSNRPPATSGNPAPELGATTAMLRLPAVRPLLAAGPLPEPVVPPVYEGLSRVSHRGGVGGHGLTDGASARSKW